MFAPIIRPRTTQGGSGWPWCALGPEESWGLKIRLYFALEVRREALNAPVPSLYHTLIRFYYNVGQAPKYQASTQMSGKPRHTWQAIKYQATTQSQTSSQMSGKHPARYGTRQASSMLQCPQICNNPSQIRHTASKYVTMHPTYVKMHRKYAALPPQMCHNAKKYATMRPNMPLGALGGGPPSPPPVETPFSLIFPQ